MQNQTYPEIANMQSFKHISLGEMDEVKLLNRTDTKFVMRRSLINELFQPLSEAYRCLNVEGNIISRYKTLYFDTPDHHFYMTHHNGYLNRYKVRIRKYVESGIFFLEIKNKRKGRTIKSRIRVSGFEEELSADSKAYIGEVMGDSLPLESKLYNSFGRVTLVNNEEQERLTIDFDLGFQWKNQEHQYDHVVIAELKQDGVNRNSLFYRLMKENGVRPTGMSKYCLGAMSLDSELKYNNFKPKKLLIDKLKS